MKESTNTLIIAALVALFMIQKCNHDRDVDRVSSDAKASIEYVAHEKQQLIQDKSIQAAELITMKQHLVSSSIAIKELIGEIEGLKKVNGHIKAELVTKLDGIKADIKDPVIIYVDSTSEVPDAYMKLPARFSKKDMWTNIDGSITTSGVEFDSLSFINKFDVTIGEKKTGLFKREPVVMLRSYNPYTTSPYVNNVIVDKPKNSIFASKPAMFLYGLGAGFIGSKLITNGSSR